MITLRAATLDDVALLRSWDDDPDVVASGGGGYEWETEIPVRSPWSELLIAQWNDEPVGFMQIADPALEESHYWGDCEQHLRSIDIWIGGAEHRGRGIGTAMMRAAIDRCFSSPDVTAIIIDPLVRNERARRFYERLGFEFVEVRRFDNDECAVYRLERSNRP
ncbi:MAG: acetyltransferase [Actinobacteria bacterium]|nr:acetyltransferase [Actinomycetota bacterium]